jgi:hypothetical protein
MSAATPTEQGGGPESSRTNYGGMTVNERLFVSGLMDEFDAAARDRDRDAMIAVLMKVALTQKGAAQTTDAILADPSHYGY